MIDTNYKHQKWQPTRQFVESKILEMELFEPNGRLPMSDFDIVVDNVMAKLHTQYSLVGGTRKSFNSKLTSGAMDNDISQMIHAALAYVDGK